MLDALGGGCWMGGGVDGDGVATRTFIFMIAFRTDRFWMVMSSGAYCRDFLRMSRRTSTRLVQSTSLRVPAVFPEGGDLSSSSSSFFRKKFISQFNVRNNTLISQALVLSMLHTHRQGHPQSFQEYHAFGNALSFSRGPESKYQHLKVPFTVRIAHTPTMQTNEHPKKHQKPTQKKPPLSNRSVTPRILA